jgi:predicted amidohydrolase YtcJ
VLRPLPFPLLLLLAACRPEPADLILENARIYTLAWPDPDREGRPDRAAPWSESAGWHPDAEAVAIRGGRIVYVGSSRKAERFRGDRTTVMDLTGATVLPGLVDAHVHIAELGARLERVDLLGVTTEEEAVGRVTRRADSVPKGTWIIGWGWDEGAWANRYPDRSLLSTRVPDHPVMLRGLHGFAAWTNSAGLEQAGITRETLAPPAGEIRKDARGEPTGLLLNSAVRLLEHAIPPPTSEEMEARVLHGLEAMAASGYVAVHEAGAGAPVVQALQSLDARDALPIRVYLLLDARDSALMQEWLTRGPQASASERLAVWGVKAFDDGALGSRGARLLADYSDQPGYRGLEGGSAGFDHGLIAEAMQAGFQIAIHAIGDAGNRETLSFFDSALAAHPEARAKRHRIEHAQVLHPDDLSRFARLDIIASMQPPHAVEDMPWAEVRLGPERVHGAYAWRSLRRAGARLVFSSDLAGSDHNIFYGLHAAMTRRDKAAQPAGGWHPEERMSPEEAVRGYTSWAAYAGFDETEAGTILPGRRADLTVLSVDPFVIGSSRAPEALLQGSIRLTVVGGKVVGR